MNQPSKPTAVHPYFLGLTLLVVLWTSVGTAADGSRPPWTSSKIQGTPAPPPAFALRPAYPNRQFDLPSSLEEIPGGRILVTEIGGKLFTFPKADAKSDRSDLLLNIEGAKLWHATVHPDFASNHRLFVCYSKGEVSCLSEFLVGGSPPLADAATEKVLITWPAGGHNAGCVKFGTDGMLYVSTGDGSGPNPPDGRTAAQDVSNLFGCILRLDVNQRDGDKNYAIPADNPFVDVDSARGEIWAYGLRNPWKFGVDRETGNIFAADNGWESWEMVHEIVRGGNCGWPIMEGRAILRSEVKRGPTPIRPPVKDHSHTEANSVVGGPIYRGSRLDLNGTFVYGDYITGTIWGLTKSENNSFAHRTLVDTDQRIVAFAEGSKGELYVLDYDLTGQIYELVPSGLVDRSANFPRKLSDTGIFESLEELKPVAGVLPYAITVKRWMDGYETRRFVAIPADGTIDLAKDDQPAVYPEGTVFVKHVVLPKGKSGARDVPVETQLLHFENGTWHPYTYAWNNVLNGEPFDAHLVDSTGANRQVVNQYGKNKEPLGPTRHFSAENECRLCHNAGSGFVLGFTPNQLNRGFFERTLADQIEQLAAEKTISQMPSFPEKNPGRLVDPHDEKQTLDDRARSYLHANCSSCHHPGGNAIVSFYLRREMPFAALNTNKGTGIGTFGMPDAKLIVPGDPYRSVLFYRMAKLGYGRMPYIGSDKVDSRGVVLIDAWIRSMKPDKLPPLPFTSVLGLHPGMPKESVNRIIPSTPDALAIVSRMHAKGSSTAHAQFIYEATPGDIRGLFETFVPEDARRKTLGPNANPESVLSLTGDTARGQLIYFSDGARCRDCHHRSEANQSTGPTLEAIGKKYKTREEMLQHIVNPSLKVDDQFAMWLVTTNDGEVLRGLVLSNSDKEVVLKTAERKEIRVAKEDIDEMIKSKRSLMPQGILADLTAQEAADLLDWLVK